ncbi:hypothetical protein MG293_007644 [Ovis ammon polii]|nr:hypothetical protein MG293_007644 [Ovis ammon polii]KAI4573575.1 hypothetical protein MJT46_004815 [Ovis ammon polii x Ovis aries]
MFKSKPVKNVSLPMIAKKNLRLGTPQKSFRSVQAPTNTIRFSSLPVLLELCCAFLLICGNSFPEQPRDKRITRVLVILPLSTFHLYPPSQDNSMKSQRTYPNRGCLSILLRSKSTSPEEYHTHYYSLLPCAAFVLKPHTGSLANGGATRRESG